MNKQQWQKKKNKRGILVRHLRRDEKGHAYAEETTVAIKMFWTADL